MILGIVAVSKNGVIGNQGTIPWHCKEDLWFFRKMTTGFPCIMGHTTFKSLPRLLTNRIHVVLTRNSYHSSNPWVQYLPNLEEALFRFPDSFIIGGASVYEQSMNDLDGIYISIIQKEVKGDRFFRMPATRYRSIMESDEVSIRYYPLK